MPKRLTRTLSNVPLHVGNTWMMRVLYMLAGIFAGWILCFEIIVKHMYGSCVV